MRLWVRAEASAAIGFGHLMRCLALAEAAREAGVAVCFSGTYDESVRRLLATRGFTDIVAPALLRVEAEPGDAVVFDGYGFTSEDHASIPSGVRRGAIDDRRAGRYDVDVLVNQNLPSHTAYDVPSDATVLLGPSYALVRREFTRRRRHRASGRRLLVTFGGSDVAGVGHAVAAWAAEHGAFDVTLLLGPAAPDGGALDGIEVVRAPDDIGAVFDQADIAVSAAGSTVWELCAMGIPAALVQVAGNQQDVARPVADRGAAVFVAEAPVEREALDSALDVLADPMSRASLSSAALELVDGRGPRRVLNALLPDASALLD